MDNSISPKSFKTKRIQKAIEVSAQMFLRQSIDEVKMTDIAEECGVGVATLYRYFGTKTGIAIAAMTHLWTQLRDMFSDIFESEVFLSQPGLKQLKDLMRMFVVLYEAHPSFMRLLAEFDLIMLKENVPKESLKEYEKSVINFYPVFEKAYLAGLADGTVRQVDNIRLFYVSHAHSLMEVSKKLIQGEILPSDNFTFAVEELETLIASAVADLQKR